MSFTVLVTMFGNVSMCYCSVTCFAMFDVCQSRPAPSELDILHSVLKFGVPTLHKSFVPILVWR